MFKQPLAKQKRAKFPWGLLVFIVGGASFLFAPSIYSTDSNPQITPLDSAATVVVHPTESATAVDNLAGQTFLLAEYNPTPPFYEISQQSETDDTVQPETISNSDQALPTLYPDSGLVASSDWETSGALILKVAFVLGLVYLALSGLRWVRQKKFGATVDGSTITVLETVNLAPGRGLHLVTVGEKTLLIGSTEQHLTMLTELANLTPPLPEGASQFEQNLSEVQTEAPIMTTRLDANASVQNMTDGPPANYSPKSINIDTPLEADIEIDQVTYSPQSIAAKKPTPVNEVTVNEVTPTGFEWEMMLGQLRDDIERVRESSEG